MSGIIFVIRNGLRWRDAPAADGPHTTIYKRVIRWSRLGVFNRIFAALVVRGEKPDQLKIDALPRAKTLLGDKGSDADWLPIALAQPGIAACIASKASRKAPIPHDTGLDRRRHKIEIMFGRLKDWRRIHTRYERCAHTLVSAISIVATVIFWLNQ